VTKINQKTSFPAFQKGFAVFRPIAQTTDIFQEKINFLGLQSPIRIRIRLWICMDPHGLGALDPEPDPNSYKKMNLDEDADPHFTRPQQRFFY
jgi:hypothetical protein